MKMTFLKMNWRKIKMNHDIETIINRLSEDVIEACYRHQQHKYHIEDARINTADYLQDDTTNIIISITEDDYDVMATLFEDHHDCNIADNDQWHNIISNYIKQLPAMNQFVKQTLDQTEK